MAFLESEGYYNLREVPGRGVCGMENMIFTVALWVDLRMEGRNERYCFPNRLSASKALEEWNGTGDPGWEWIKHKSSGGERSNR